MSLPDVTMQVQDGALGLTPPIALGSSVSVGVCSGGTPNVLYGGFSDLTTMQAQLGYGPLVEAMAQKIAVAGGPQYAMPVTPSVFGVCGSVTHVGSSATVTPSLAPIQAITITIVQGGALGTMTFTVQLGSGPVSAPIASVNSPPWSYLVPGTLTNAIFAAGTYVANDTYVIAITGAVTHTGSGPAGAVTQLSSSLDSAAVTVACTTAGALGTAAFTYQLDAGSSVVGPIVTPGGGAYAIPNTGIVLTFSGTFVKGDTYTFSVCAPSYGNTDVTNAIAALLANAQQWFMLHVVGMQSSASAAESLAAVVDTQMTNAAAQYRFVFAIVECPTVGSILNNAGAVLIDSADTDSSLSSTFGSFSSVRVGVVAGDCDLVSPITGRIQRRNLAHSVAARLCAIAPSTSGARVKDGALKGVTKLYRDENLTQGLDAQRFITGRTITGLQGFYCTNTRIMAASTSDFQYIELRRVMDLACFVARQYELQFLQDDVRTNPQTGYIDERDAKRFENQTNSGLAALVVAPGYAVKSSVVLNRQTNIISTGSEPVQVRVQPKAYLRQITTNIGFTNPALQLS